MKPADDYRAARRNTGRGARAKALKAAREATGMSEAFPASNSFHGAFPLVGAAVSPARETAYLRGATDGGCGLPAQIALACDARRGQVVDVPQVIPNSTVLGT